MADALYGLLGVVGGSLVTAVAGIWGPLQLQRRELNRQRDELTRAQAESTRAQRDVLVAQAAEAIVLMRTAAREWEQLLKRFAQDLSAGRSVDVSDFDSAVWSVRQEALAAVDRSVVTVGIWVEQDGSPAFGLHSTLREATLLTRAMVLAGPPLSAEQQEELAQTLRTALEARLDFSRKLLDELESIARRSYRRIGGAAQ